MRVIALKLAVSLFLTFVSWILIKQRGRIKTYLTPVQTPPFLLVAWVGLRLLPFVGIFLVLGFEPRSDIEYYYNVINPAFRGGFVYRDFHCPYGPFFPYFVGSIFLLWYSEKALVLFMVLMEGLTLFVTTRFFERHFKLGQ